jgi:hypothetical protein
MHTIVEAYQHMFSCLQRAQYYVMGSVAQCLLSSRGDLGEHILIDGPKLVKKVRQDIDLIDAACLLQPLGVEHSICSLPSRAKDLKVYIAMEKGYIGKMEVSSVKKRVSDLVSEARVLRVLLARVLGEGGDGEMGLHAGLQGAMAIECWLVKLVDRMKRCARHHVF